MEQAQQQALGGHALSAWEQMRLWGYWLGPEFLSDCYVRPKAQDANTSAPDCVWEFRGLYATGR